ncbi:MAG TPA: hypothetical protein PKD53_30245 [Chloroflexaceae bacterium]|nr:hypothetical protein [Chloroflexaceae bacterium]
MPIWGKLFLLGFGLVFLAVGLGLGIWGPRNAEAQAARAEGLEAKDAAAVEAAPAGSEALVEAVVSDRNPPAFRDFVAYRAEEYRGEDDDGDPRWAAHATVTPRLLLEAGGVVTLANDDYRLEGAHARYQDPGPLTRGDLFRESTKRYQGLVAGGTVTVIGAVAPGAEGNELRAELVYAGTRAEYIAGQRQTAAFLPYFGALFGVIGAALAGFGLFALLRG